MRRVTAILLQEKNVGPNVIYNVFEGRSWPGWLTFKELEVGTQKNKKYASRDRAGGGDIRLFIIFYLLEYPQK